MAGTGYRNREGFEVRPALPSDVPELIRVTLDAFGPGDDRTPDRIRARAEHFMRDAHPSSAVAETASGRLVGLAVTRQLGPIVLLAWAAVSESEQGRGILRALLAGFPAASPGAQRLVLSSTDPKAVRRYTALGLSLHPTVSAGGILRPRAVGDAPGTEERSPGDAAAILDELGLEARGAAYGADVDLMAAQGDRVHLCGPDAAVVRNGGVIRLAVARDETAARLALRAALAAVPPGATVHLNQLRAGMDWAVAEAHDAGLAFSPEGPVFSDQPLSPLHLPQGSLG